MRRKDSLKKTLMLGTIEGKRRRARQRLWWLDGVTDAVSMGPGGLWGAVEDRNLYSRACCLIENTAYKHHNRYVFTWLRKENRQHQANFPREGVPEMECRSRKGPLPPILFP
ncbi:NADH-quinone oxidoreductase subunit C/D 2 [Varanus komodoensis]|nr:NADH-quinone oxidoreductase subunit C/D 2 [Varanus komodoensis]